jgi:hypothetical protein
MVDQADVHLMPCLGSVLSSGALANPMTAFVPYRTEVGGQRLSTASTLRTSRSRPRGVVARSQRLHPGSRHIKARQRIAVGETPVGVLRGSTAGGHRCALAVPLPRFRRAGTDCSVLRWPSRHVVCIEPTRVPAVPIARIWEVANHDPPRRGCGRVDLGVVADTHLSQPVQHRVDGDTPRRSRSAGCVGIVEGRHSELSYDRYPAALGSTNFKSCHARRAVRT